MGEGAPVKVLYCTSVMREYRLRFYSNHSSREHEPTSTPTKSSVSWTAPIRSPSRAQACHSPTLSRPLPPTVSVSDPSARSDLPATGKDESDAYEYILQTMKDLTAAPFLTGVIQGFISVACRGCALIQRQVV